MAQFVIYGHAAALRPRIRQLSDAIHEAAVSALQLPVDKRFHRFVPLDPDCLIAPPDRSHDYTVIEVSMFEGRSAATKKSLILELFRTTSAIGLSAQDVEITITETPRANLGYPRCPRRRAPAQLSSRSLRSRRRRSLRSTPTRRWVLEA